MSSKLPHPGRSSALSCSANMLRSGRGAVNSQRNDADKSATILQTVGVHFLQNFLWCLEIARKRGCYKTILVSSLREETPPTDPVLVLAIHSAILGNEWRQALRSRVSRQKSKKMQSLWRGSVSEILPMAADTLRGSLEGGCSIHPWCLTHPLRIGPRAIPLPSDYRKCGGKG